MAPCPQAANQGGTATLRRTGLPVQQPAPEPRGGTQCGHVGKSVCIHSPFHCDFGSQISIGDDFTGNFNLTILDEAPVTIGDHVFIGPNVGIYTVTHALLPDQRNAGVMRSLPITIGDNVWIGGNCVVMQGVTIGDGTVIGAGSVVTRDIPAGVIAFGNPCRVIRPVTEDDRITEVV